MESFSENTIAGQLAAREKIRSWVLRQPAAVLADILIKTSTRDEHLHEKLLRFATRDPAKEPDFSVYREAINRAIHFPKFYRPGKECDFSPEKLCKVVLTLREVLDEEPAHAAAIVGLAEDAFESADGAVAISDDSAGSAITYALLDLQELHLEACKVARPAPEVLVARLFAWETSDCWDIFRGAAEIYAEALGAAGLAAYRRFVEAILDKFSALNSDSSGDNNYIRYCIKDILKSLARIGGDTAELINEYQRWQRPDETISLVWHRFEFHPYLEEYQCLKHHAERAAVWSVWRKRALAHLCEKIACADASFPWKTEKFSSALVRIHLWEKDTETAWLVAQQLKLDDKTWFELADARAKTHPADAIPIYLRAAEPIISRPRRSAYGDAAVWLKKIKELYLRLNQLPEWKALLARLRAVAKSKRNFDVLMTGL
jgi:hypothetical protein